MSGRRITLNSTMFDEIYIYEIEEQWTEKQEREATEIEVVQDKVRISMGVIAKGLL